MDRMKNLGIVRGKGSKGLFMVFEEGKMSMLSYPSSSITWPEIALRTQLERKIYCPIEFLE